jgi:uncharacterized protein YjiS (DUF1127 family)
LVILANTHNIKLEIKIMLKWLKRVLVRLQESRQAEADRRIAMMQLRRFSDRELSDLGIGRGQIRDVVYNGKTAY